MTKSVFIVSQKTILTESLSLEVEDDIDDMFEIFRSGNIATFGDMADDNERGLCVFGCLMESFATCLDLSWRPHDAVIALTLHGLDTIDDHDIVASALHRGDDIINTRRMKTMICLTSITTQSRISRHDLFTRLFATTVGPSDGRCVFLQVMDDLQYHRGLTDAWLTSEEIDGTSHDRRADDSDKLGE